MYVLDTYKNETGEIVTKVETIEGTVLVEGFVNSEQNLEYDVYRKHDGGVVDMDTKKLSLKEINTLFLETIDKVLDTKETYE